MAQFSKFKFPFALKLNFNRGHFYKEISKFGYFEKWKKIRKITKVTKVEHLHWKGWGNLITIK